MFVRPPLLALGAAVVSAMLTVAPHRSTLDLPAQRLGPYGGPSGSEFTLGCGHNGVLTGFSAGRSDSAITSIAALCRSVDEFGQLASKAGSPDGLAGTGDIAATRHCPAGSVAGGLIVYKTSTHVVGLELICRTWIPGSRRFDTIISRVSFGVVTPTPGVSAGFGSCASTRQPITEIFGRTKEKVLALGAECDEP